ncbi:MAG: hypothetical protein AB7G44_03560 [Bacteroidia bacterium]
MVYIKHENTICVSLYGLINVGWEKLNPSVRPDGSERYELWGKWMSTAKQMQAVRQIGGRGRQSLIALEAIPSVYREEIIKTFGDPSKQASSNSFKGKIQPDEKAARFFIEYTMADGKHLPEQHQKLYTASACILNAIKEIYNNQREARAALGGTMRNFWKQMSEVLTNLRGEINHSLPKNPLALKRKYDDYCNAGFESLINGRFCNSNTTKITDEIEAWIVKEMASKRQSIEMIYMLYPAAAAANGWRTDITLSAFKTRIAEQRVRDLIDLKRHGRRGFRKLHGHSFKLSKPEYSNDIWVSDGTALNWYYRIGKEVGLATTYVVMDSRSRKILGRSTKAGINKENGEMQREAYRMALRNAGSKPYQLLYDNQGGHKGKASAEFYSKLAQVCFPTRAYRPSGKPIEQMFKDFQTLKLSEFPFWSGYGRPSHSNLAYAPNMDDIKKNITELPDFNELCSLLDVIIEEWNNLGYRDKQSPNEIYSASRNPEEAAVTLDELAELFWDIQGAKKYNPIGIKLRLNGVDTLYEVYNDEGDVDYEFRRKYLHREMYLKYDPDGEYTEVDLLIVHGTGGYQKIASAQPKREVSRSVKYLKDGDKEWINRQMKLEEEMMDEMDAIVADTGYTESEKWGAWKKRIETTVPVLAADEGEEDIDKLLKERM